MFEKRKVPGWMASFYPWRFQEQLAVLQEALEGGSLVEMIATALGIAAGR